MKGKMKREGRNEENTTDSRRGGSKIILTNITEQGVRENGKTKERLCIRGQRTC